VVGTERVDHDEEDIRPDSGWGSYDGGVEPHGVAPGPRLRPALWNGPEELGDEFDLDGLI
jgi:hypothetical protein